MRLRPWQNHRNREDLLVFDIAGWKKDLPAYLYHQDAKFFGVSVIEEIAEYSGERKILPEGRRGECERFEMRMAVFFRQWLLTRMLARGIVHAFDIHDLKIRY